MILLGHLLIGIGGALHIVIWLFLWLFIVRAILSWFSPDPRNLLVQYLYSATDPVLAKIRRKVPPIGMIDVSVIIVIAGLFLIDELVGGSLISYGEYFKRAAFETVGI